MKNISYIKLSIPILLTTIAWHAVANTTMLMFSLSTMPFFNIPLHSNPCYLDNISKKRHALTQSFTHYSLGQCHPLPTQVKRDFIKMNAAYLCAYQASVLGVAQLPAIVFAQHYVVYGERNIDKANRLFQHYKEHHHAVFN